MRHAADGVQSLGEGILVHLQVPHPAVSHRLGRRPVGLLPRHLDPALGPALGPVLESIRLATGGLG